MQSKVREVLLSEKVSGARVKYYPNTGNAGDSLINVGFYQLADEVGLEYEVIDRDEPVNVNDTDVIIIGGGGALVPEWSATPEFLGSVIGKCKKIVILPQSIRGVDALLQKLGIDDIIFCREKYSFNGCESLGLSCSLYLADDMAFYVDVKKLRDSKKEFPKLNYKNLIRSVVYNYHLVVRSNISRRIGAFRCDKESNYEVKVKRRRMNDFSAIARFGSGSIGKSNYSAHMFLNLIDRYDEIDTDRLHVIIGAALLEKKVNAYPNSYYKVRGVIEHSLGGYPNVMLNDV